MVTFSILSHSTRILTICFNLSQFNKIQIKCSTGCDPLVFKGYGCYCGFLGSGYALDGIDRCCKMHDYCYETAHCPSFLEYFVPYLWKCYRGKPVCGKKICQDVICINI